MSSEGPSAVQGRDYLDSQDPGTRMTMTGQENVSQTTFDDIPIFILTAKGIFEFNFTWELNKIKFLFLNGQLSSLKLALLIRMTLFDGKALLMVYSPLSLPSVSDSQTFSESPLTYSPKWLLRTLKRMQLPTICPFLVFQQFG